jgi:phosphoglycolate phosphatase
MAKNIIFDLDGTLVDSAPGIVEAASLAVTEVLPGRALPDFRLFIGPPIREILVAAMGELDSGQLDRLQACYRKAYDERGCANARPFPGVLTALAALRQTGCHLFVLTNKPRRPTETMLAHLHLAGFFQAVMALDSNGTPFRSKSEAARALGAAQTLAPEETVLVGDSLDDARAAADCSFAFIAVRFGYGTAHSQTAYPIRAVAEDFAQVAALCLPPSLL